MITFVHPATEDIALSAVLSALADPMRLRILRSLIEEKSCMSCIEAVPCPDMPKSTLSSHFRVLREAGLIRTTKKGVENRNSLRFSDVESRFPGLLKTVLYYADK